MSQNKDAMQKAIPLTDAQTPVPPPRLPERPSAQSIQDVIKGLTAPPPPVLPQSPMASAVNQTSPAATGGQEQPPPSSADQQKP